MRPRCYFWFDDNGIVDGRGFTFPFKFQCECVLRGPNRFLGQGSHWVTLDLWLVALNPSIEALVVENFWLSLTLLWLWATAGQNFRPCATGASDLALCLFRTFVVPRTACASKLLSLGLGSTRKTCVKHPSDLVSHSRSHRVQGTERIRPKIRFILGIGLRQSIPG